MKSNRVQYKNTKVPTSQKKRTKNRRIILLSLMPGDNGTWKNPQERTIQLQAYVTAKPFYPSRSMKRVDEDEPKQSQTALKVGVGGPTHTDRGGGRLKP